MSRPPVCACGACRACTRREIRRRHYEKHGERVRQEQRQRVEAKKAARERYWASPEYKERKRYELAMAQGKAPAHGVFALHDAHVKAREARTTRKMQWRPAQTARGLHSAHVRTWRNARPGEWFRHYYHRDPDFNLRHRMRQQFRKASRRHPGLDTIVREALKRDGRSSKVESVLGYTVRDLRQHLERQFLKGMTWDEFAAGRIHIDHITPQSAFDLSQDHEVMACWCLSNLRPLWAEANLRKGARRERLL